MYGDFVLKQVLGNYYSVTSFIYSAMRCWRRSDEPLLFSDRRLATVFF